MNSTKGFTLIELMVVISIIGILAAIAIPQFQTYKQKGIITEGYSLAGPVRLDIQDYFDVTGVLPENNTMAGLAQPEFIRGKYVESVTVDQGAITVGFNDSYESLAGYYFKLIPEINADNPTGPLVWEIKKKEERRE